MRRWLARPHVRRWWGNPDNELALIDEDIDEGITDMRIVRLKQTHFACVQDYPCQHWPMPHFKTFPKTHRAMDSFLGEPDLLGQGHGAGFLRARALELLDSRASGVLADPDEKNIRSVAAHLSAGFTRCGVLPSEDGDLVEVMEFGAIASKGQQT